MHSTAPLEAVAERKAAPPVSSAPRPAPIEWALAILVIGGAIMAAVVLVRHGRLPTPYYDPARSLMDWYDTAWWARRPHGAYEVWRTVYPPLSFVLIRRLGPDSCYLGSPLAARACDGAALPVLGALALLAAAMAHVAFRRAGARTAAPRALALLFGSPMIYALDRGNLVLAALPIFILAFGGLLRGRWGRAVAAAAAINLKPYLLLTAFAFTPRSRWAQLARIGLAGLAIYLVSWMLLGDGGPVRLVAHLFGAARPPGRGQLDLMTFSSTFDALWIVSHTNPAVGALVGPVGRLAAPVIAVAGIGALLIGSLACTLRAARAGGGLAEARIAAMGLSVFFAIGTPGGYALIFLIFLVFLEPWRGAARKTAIVAAYLWGAPLDLPLARLGGAARWSYAAGAMVWRDADFTLGELLRPALLLIIGGALVVASWNELDQARARREP